MDGILIVDKPIGKTSFDMVREVRNKYNTKKVGHIGTLDPMASGVLPILIGNATKLSNILVEHDKEYIAVLKLGKRTDTGDAEGNVIETDENYIEKLNKSQIQVESFIIQVLESFLGDSMQIPPMYSAIKVNGKKLYELARAGKAIERTPRKINISEIELLECKISDEIKFRVVCSKGTYIRVLCEDIAKKIGTCGCMNYLRRTRVGDFKIEDANKFIEMEKIFNIPQIDITKDEYKKISNGVIIYKANVSYYTGICNVYCGETYVGICSVESGKCKRKIFVI